VRRVGGHWWSLLVYLTLICSPVVLVWSLVGTPTATGMTYVLGGIFQFVALLYAVQQLAERSKQLDETLSAIERKRIGDPKIDRLATTSPLHFLIAVVVKAVLNLALVRRSDLLVLVLGLVGFLAQQVAGFPVPQ